MADWAFVTAHGDDHDDLSLGELFETCTRVHSSLSSLPRDVDTAQRILHACERLINSCVHRIDTAGIVSRNEELDDVATESIRFFLAQFYLAEVLSETREQDSELRMKYILSAKRQYIAFLTQSEQFELLHPVVAGTLQRINKDEHIDGNLLRGEKIEQKRQEMQLGQKIKGLEAAAHAAQQSSGDDEEIQRDLWIAKVKHATIKSVQAVGMLAQELPMLEMRVQQESRQQRCCRDEDAEDDVDEEAEAAKRAMREKIFEIANNLSMKRENIRAGVFKPSHILPTYSVEQAGIIELEEMKMREAVGAQREAAENQRLADLGPEGVEEEELRAQRQLDDWKDDHPTGYGNSKLRPCAL